MANQEEQSNPNEQKEQSTPAENQSQNTADESTQSGGSHKQDPAHNTGNEHMMIDEEGAEVKPGDEV